MSSDSATAIAQARETQAQLQTSRAVGNQGKTHFFFFESVLNECVYKQLGKNQKKLGNF